MGVCENSCCVAAVVKDSGFLSLGVLLYVCVRGVMDVVFSVCIVTRGALGARVWVVWVFLVSILWQFSMLHSI